MLNPPPPVVCGSVVVLQAAQIQLDRAAEDFRALHQERQDLIRQWDEARYAMKSRDEAVQVREREGHTDPALNSHARATHELKDEMLGVRPVHVARRRGVCGKQPPSIVAAASWGWRVPLRHSTPCATLVCPIAGHGNSLC